MVFLFFEIDQEKERFEGNYKNLKKRYQDILDELDIKKIFNSDRDHDADVEYIKKKRYRYAWAWSGTHIVLFFLIFFLTYLCPQSLNLNSDGQKSASPQKIQIAPEISNTIPTAPNPAPLKKKIEDNQIEPKSQDSIQPDSTEIKKQVENQTTPIPVIREPDQKTEKAKKETKK